MVRHPEPISWLDEIVSYFESGKSGQKKWFTRKMNLLTPDQQETVWQTLESRGHQRPQTEDRPTRTIISWTDEEWDTLTDLVWNARKDDPTETLVGLCKVVMDKFPENRRRNIRVLAEIKPLAERLTKRDSQTAATAEDLELHRLHVEELEAQRKSVLTKDEIIGTLTDDEILNNFRDRVLQLVPPDDLLRQHSPETLLAYIPLPDAAAHLARSIVESFVDNQKELVSAIKDLTATVQRQPQNGQQPAKAKPSMPMPKPHGQRLAKVTIIGLLGIQQEKVQKRLEGRANFNFVDKNRKPDQSVVPDGQDIVLLAANFISHSMQEVAKRKVSGTNTKLIVHHGGVDTLVRKLDAVLPQLVFA